MKKNFFKKLSFVLALAMIVTALAPAAGVFAAAKPKLNSKDKTLFLSVEGKDEFDFNIANKKTGWSYKWTSANKKVATVNAKNGVTTAVGAGKTSVSVVIKDKKGEEVTTLKASVLVRDNIKELTITNKPEGDKLAVGASNDFNRSYKTVAGLTKGSQAITRWVVTDKDGKVATTATIDDKGVFTASEAGVYTITANAFQSKAKYTSWLADSEKYASYVTATATYEVTVAASIVDAKQTTLNKFELTFDSAIKDEDVKKNLVVSYMVGQTEVKELVNEVSMDDSGKIATVKMYIPFTKGATYVAKYPEMGSAQFVAATTKVEDVVDIAILTKTAELSTKTPVDVALYNKDGVNIGGDDVLAARVIVDKKDNNLASLEGKDLYMFKIGETVTLEATFHTYNWVDGKEVGNLTATGVVTCVDQAKDVVGSLNAYTVGAARPQQASIFKDVKHQIFKGTNAQLYVQLKGKAANGDDLYTNNLLGNGGWKFVSNNSDILLADAGTLYAVKEGTAVVVVYYNDAQVAACEITVVGARKAAVATLKTNNIALSNEVPESTTVALTVKDQLGNDYVTGNTKHYTATVKPVNVTNNSTKLIGATVNNPTASATNGVVFTPHTVEAGTYYYNVTIVDSDNDIKLYANITVTVQDANGAVSYYRIEAKETSYDLKDDSIAEFAVYGYTAAGVKKVKLSGSDVNGLSIQKTDGTSMNATWSGATATASLWNDEAYTVSGAAKTVKVPVATGTYIAKATSVTGSTVVSPFTFEVTNSRDAVKVTQNKSVAAKGEDTLLKAINDCFDFAIGDDSYDVVYEFATRTSDGANRGVSSNTAGGKKVSINYVYIYEPTGNVDEFYAHKVDLGGVVITIGDSN